MPSLPQSIPPIWEEESDSFRETTLMLFDDPADRDAVRRVGWVLHDLALEASREPGEESTVRAELRAAAADLRFTGRYLFNVIRRSAEWCSLDADDDKMARFAGKLSRKVAALVKKIERWLS